MPFDPEAVGITAFRLMRFIRVEHTVYTLPMAYAAALLAGGQFGLWEAVLIGLAVFGLRTAGMSWNNIADYPIDRLNPRTQGRMLVSGAVSLTEAYCVFALGAATFLVSAAMLGPWPAVLAPLYLAVVIAYPYAKRVHCLPHLHLGAVYALLPLGASIAVHASDISTALARTPWLLVTAAALWVSGFDVAYSREDAEFDRRHGLGSVAACYGTAAANAATVALLTASAALYLANYIAYGLGLTGLIVTAAGAAVEVYSAAAGVRGRSALCMNLNLAVGVLIPLGIFTGLYVRP
ncbi:MAG: putative 4-hydroxybenzoate polyprenyltransferase [Thermoproteaceae archaeon]|nr:putative 4-hydroxybenzoate polyprenyltransferase [Thermoproteaceae archaeon]